MTCPEYQKKLENELVKEFLKTFYEKIGYYPIVITDQKPNINTPKSISLQELEKHFDPFLPIIYGKKHKLSSKNRSRSLCELRYIFSQLARSMHYRLSEIGTHLGKRDHTTIMNGLTMFKSLYETDERFKQKYHEIINHIIKNYEPSTVDYINQAQDQPQSNLFLGLLQGENTAK
jgi:hypothetical protein